MQINKNSLNTYSTAYNQLKAKWTDALDLYEPIPGSLARFLPKHTKEDPEEYAVRLRKVAQVNAIKLIVDFYLSQLFSTNVRITSERHQDKVDSFIASCNQRGDSLLDFYREQVTPLAFVFGSVDVFCDLPEADQPVSSLAEQQSLGLDQPYCFVVPPLNRVRWQTDDAGRYTFYQSRDEIDTAINASMQIKHLTQYQCWMPDRVAVFDKDGTVISDAENPYGFVPAVAVTPLPSRRYYSDALGISLIDDQIDLQKLVITTLSMIEDYQANMNFAQFTMIWDTEEAGEPPPEGELKELGNKRGLMLKGKGSDAKFVSPDPAGIESMCRYFDQLLDKMFQIALIPVNSTDIKTHTSSSTIRSNFASLYNRLTTISKQLAKSMKQVIDMSLRIRGIDPAEADVSVQWENSFSYEAFISALEELREAKAVAADLSPTAVKELTKRAMSSKLYDSGKMEEINDEIDAWVPQPVQPEKPGVDPINSDNQSINAAAKISEE